jgi:hypothetical protein
MPVASKPPRAVPASSPTKNRRRLPWFAGCWEEEVEVGTFMTGSFVWLIAATRGECWPF